MTTQSKREYRVLACPECGRQLAKHTSTCCGDRFPRGIKVVTLATAEATARAEYARGFAEGRRAEQEDL